MVLPWLSLGVVLAAAYLKNSCSNIKKKGRVTVTGVEMLVVNIQVFSVQLNVPGLGCYVQQILITLYTVRY